MSDYIKREDAIKALEGWKISGEMILATVPSADVRENVRGEWIDDGIHGDWAWETDGHGVCWQIWKCSRCGRGTKIRSNYCPNCGAEMRPISALSENVEIASNLKSKADMRGYKMSNFKVKPKAKNVYYEEHYHTEFKCSLCGATINCVEGGSMDGAKFNYCPWCGAEMEEEPEI